ncbi:MAG TPA: hypothetical protein VGI81_25555 [Tepidisphaeraceae bacterium]|jgi:hypothetical protein
MTRTRIIRLIVCLALGIVIAAGFIRLHPRVNAWWALRPLDGAERYELFSLEPWMGVPAPGAGWFCNHAILGRVVITDRAVQDRLNTALRAGAWESDGSVGACFNPRHGIRVTHAGVNTDYLICFECRQVQVWRDGKLSHTFLTAPTPQPPFDDVLRAAGVPLPSH